MVTTYQDTVLSPIPCQKLHHSYNWKTKCSAYQIVHQEVEELIKCTDRTNQQNDLG